MPSRVAPPPTPEPSTDPLAAARAAGLRYVSDDQPGIRRRKAGRGFVYLDPDGRPIRDADELRRIKALAIPPAWTEVWICPNPRGHIQAIGRDARGRKQYRYHPRWREVRDETKYDRMIAFAQALPQIRERVEKDLQRPGMPREKVLATVVRLLETTLIRVGNEEYARENGSFGLTTLRNRHVKVEGGQLRFRFRGKGGIQREVAIADRRLARVIRNCQELPGQQLFQYRDNGEYQTIESDDVNEYLRETTGQDFTAKDFRTWAGTVLAARALQEFTTFDSEVQAKRNVMRAIEAVAARLGNTRTVCRSCYIHPAVIDSYLDQSMLELLEHRAEQEMDDKLRSLPPEEAAVLALLRSRLERDVHTNNRQGRQLRSA